jgi:hypothetical protein
LAQWLSQDQRKGLLALLRQEYIEEMENSIRLRGHAARMRYPQFRERLFQMADEERKHAEWLSQTIVTLGGGVPRISFMPEERPNSWEYLRLDLDQERHCIWDFEEMVAQVERVDPGIAARLAEFWRRRKGIMTRSRTCWCEAIRRHQG